MKKWTYHIIFLLAILVVAPAQAKIISDLYRVQVPVNSQGSGTERDQAIITAFQQVLIKISGNSQINSNATIIPALPNASNYMQQYSYVWAPLFGQAADTSGPKATRLALQVVFDSAQVKQLLQSANQLIWGRDRPLALLWLAVDQGQGPILLSDSSGDQAVVMLQQLAAQRGLPLVWPTLPDSTQPQASGATLPVADIWQLNIDNIKTFSKSYNANLIVIVRLTQANGQWSSQWTAIVNDEPLTFQATGSDEMIVLQQGMDSVVDAVAQRYAVKDQVSKNQVTVTIYNLSTLENYSKAKTYLRQLTPVQHVEVLQIEPDAVQFQVTYDGSQNDLAAAIKLDNKLIPADSKDSDIKSTINYQWQ